MSLLSFSLYVALAVFRFASDAKNPNGWCKTESINKLENFKIYDIWMQFWYCYSRHWTGNHLLYLEKESTIDFSSLGLTHTLSFNLGLSLFLSFSFFDVRSHFLPHTHHLCVVAIQHRRHIIAICCIATKKNSRPGKMVNGETESKSNYKLPYTFGMEMVTRFKEFFITVFVSICVAVQNVSLARCQGTRDEDNGEKF